MSARENVTVVARWQIAKEHLDDVLALVAELQPKSLAEPGCLDYEVFQSVDAPGTLLLLERYRDSEALEMHRQSDHYRTLVVERILPLLMDRKVELLQARTT